MEIENKNTFNFERRELIVPYLACTKVLSSVANPIDANIVYVYTEKSELLRVDLGSSHVAVVAEFDNVKFPVGAEFYLYISCDAEYIALTCRQFSGHEIEAVCRGGVIRLKDAKNILALSAGDYHTEQTPFPVCFIRHNNKNMLVHATDWNRLDITDLETGKIITERNLEDSPDLSDDDGFVFKEWVGVLKPSPGQKRLATIGWVWHPIGAAYSFNLKSWLEGSVWETDSSLDMRSYAGWDYYWDSPFFWIGDENICIWGVGSEDSFSNPSNVVSVFNAETEETILSFEGPTNDLFFYDEYLFSGIEREGKRCLGLSIWDLSCGTLLFEIEGVHVDLYIHESKELVEFCTAGRVVINKWSVVETESI